MGTFICPPSDPRFHWLKPVKKGPVIFSKIGLLDAQTLNFKLQNIEFGVSRSIEQAMLFQKDGSLHKDKIWYQTLSSPLDP